MMLPIEILENILSKCDGKTLLSARKVDEEWKGLVDYLTQRTRIWEWCCKEEIPNNQLIEYLEHYHENDKDKWLHIYINWYSWECIDRVMCDIVVSPVKLPRISCIAVSGNYIAVGAKDGRLRIFSNNWKLLLSFHTVTVKINSLMFLDRDNGEGLDLCIVASFNKGLQVLYYDGMNKNEIIIHDVKSHSIYKNYICYEKVGGRITIAKLVNNQGRRDLTEIWFSRIYSPSSLSCMKMWDGVCTFLINNEVKIVEYEAAEVAPMDIMKKKTRIKFNFPLVDSRNTQILRNDVIISLCKNDSEIKDDIIEFFILGTNEKCSKKMFNTWETFKCFITCIYLYGNTLILGVDVGMVYIYHVSCWKNFNIRDYSHKLIIGKYPIICIDVKETPTERKFYVSSTLHVHEISGFLPNVY